MSTLEVNKITPAGAATSITLGDSGDTFTIPSGVTLTNNGTASGFGKIGQVLSTTKTDTFTTAASSLTDVTGLSVSITPSSTSSKILVMVSMTGGALANERFFVGLKRDTTQIAQGDADGSRARVSSAGKDSSSETMENFAINFLDSPSTTSSVTYQVTAFTQNASSFYLNRSYSDVNQNNHGRAASTITVMEVLA